MKPSRILVTVAAAGPAEAQQGRIAYLFGDARESGMTMGLKMVDIESGSTVSLTGDREIPISEGTDASYRLAWSPDGRRVAFKMAPDRRDRRRRQDSTDAEYGRGDPPESGLVA